MSLITNRAKVSEVGGKSGSPAVCLNFQASLATAGTNRASLFPLILSLIFTSIFIGLSAIQ